MRITRHDFDQATCRHKLAQRSGRIAAALQAAREWSTGLMSLIYAVKGAADCAIALGDQSSPQLAEWLLLNNQAHAALLAAAVADLPVGVDLGVHRVFYDSKPDESIVHGGIWLDGFALAAICRDQTALGRVLRTPTDLIRASTSRGPASLYLVVDVFRHLNDKTEAEQHIHRAAAQAEIEGGTLTGLNPPSLNLAMLRLLDSLCNGGRNFAEAFAHAIQLHKRFWKRRSNRDDSDGFFALKLTGIAALAYDAKIPFDVESDYCPVSLINGKLFAQLRQADGEASK